MRRILPLLLSTRQWQNDNQWAQMKIKSLDTHANTTKPARPEGRLSPCLYVGAAAVVSRSIHVRYTTRGRVANAATSPARLVQKKKSDGGWGVSFTSNPHGTRTRKLPAITLNPSLNGSKTITGDANAIDANRLRNAQQPFPSCRDPRLRRGWQCDRNA